MSNRARIGVCLTAILVALSGCGRKSNTAAKRTPKPDIILVSVDSLRADHLGCYGYEQPTSPTIDRLAQDGVRFASAISTTSWTLPAHAAMFTGLYDSAHGVVDNGLRLADAQVTLAEQLSHVGYTTAGFFGGPYLHPAFGLDQGFDSYQSCMAPATDSMVVRELRHRLNRAHDLSHTDRTGPRTLEKFTAWLETTGDSPFFVFLHLWDVHYDYAPPRRYIEMFDPDYAGSVTASNYTRNRAIHPGMAARDLQHILALYDGEIRFTDDILAQILAQVKQRGRLENALIIVTSDHGQEFFEHNGKGHQRTLFDEVLRVPLIVRWPGHVKAGLVVEDQVRLIDLMPTLLALAGVPLDADVQGRDLSPLLRGQTLAPEAALCELLVDRQELWALRTNEWKVLFDNIRSGGAYFDLRVDPGEQDHAARMSKQFRSALAQLRRIRSASAALGRRVGREARSIRVGEEITRQLQALGYVGGEEDQAATRPATSQPRSPVGP